MSQSTPTGKLYLTLLLISSGKADFERDAKALKLTAPEQSRAYFERCYETAYRFVFNKFVTDRIEHRYLGHRVDESGVESLGRVRTDFVLQQNDFFETHSLHVHVCFENSSFDIADPDPDAVDLPAIAQHAHVGRGHLLLPVIVHRQAVVPKRVAAERRLLARLQQDLAQEG